MIDIAFSGKMTSGKTTLANYIQKKIPNAKRMAIGGQIKKVSKYILFDWDELVRIFSGFENKKMFFHSAKKLKEKNIDTEFLFTEDGEFVKDRNYRPYIQEVGRISRDTFGESIWMDLFLKEVIKQKKGTVIICDDIRSKHEYKTLKKINKMLIRLEIDEETQIKRIKNLYGTLSPGSLTEETEIALDDSPFDFVYDTTMRSIESVGEEILKDYYKNF